MLNTVRHQEGFSLTTLSCISMQVLNEFVSAWLADKVVLPWRKVFVTTAINFNDSDERASRGGAMLWMKAGGRQKVKQPLKCENIKWKKKSNPIFCIIHR